MVNQDGTVFQKDLGDRTEKIARRIETFDPDESGKKPTPTLSNSHAWRGHFGFRACYPMADRD